MTGRKLRAWITCPKCVVCGEHPEVTVEVEEWNRWHSGELIQDVWPKATPSWREMLISGTHPDCWESLNTGWEDE